MACSHAALNEVTLSRRLPDNTAQCLVTTCKGDKAGQSAVHIDCD
ncbi:STY0301 family protein [Massilia sp. DWR3-1-1]